MQITCGHCSFSIETCGQNFYLDSEDLKFCPRCGRDYSSTGVNVTKLYEANEARIKYQSRIAFRFGFLPVMICLITILLLILLGWETINRISPEKFSSIMVGILTSALIYFGIVLRIAFSRGEKKFKEVANS